MTDAIAVTQEARERAEKIGTADLVVGFVSPPRDQQVVDHVTASVREALADFGPSLRAVLVHSGANAAGGPAEANVQILPLSYPASDPLNPMQVFADGFRGITNVARTLNARACAIIASDPAAVDRSWIAHLAGPVLDADYDLVAPCYARHRFEGLINRAIVYPLMRALYGRRVRNPFGPDFCLSARLVERVPPASGSTIRVHPVAWLVPEAIVGGMRICQSHLGVRSYPAPDDAGVSALLVQILGPLFSELERRAAFLQRVRGTQPVEEYGAAVYLPEQGTAADVSRLIETFQIGARNLQEIWSVVLPPSTLVELKRLARASAANFRMDDELWARLVYDFALAHRLRSINRDHLLRAISPLYLGWVASYAMNPENSTPEGVENLLEQLSVAYENARPYFVARWRWPDRFNP
jgi:glucosylglycerate synthase